MEFYSGQKLDIGFQPLHVCPNGIVLIGPLFSPLSIFIPVFSCILVIGNSRRQVDEEQNDGLASDYLWSVRLCWSLRNSLIGFVSACFACICVCVCTCVIASVSSSRPLACVHPLDSKTALFCHLCCAAAGGTQCIIPFRGDDMEWRHLKVSGDLGGVTPISYSPQNVDSVRRVIAGSDVVINLIGKVGNSLVSCTHPRGMFDSPG